MNNSSVQVSTTSFRILRITSSLIFIVAGLGHIFSPQTMMEKLSHSPLGQYLEELDWIPMLVQATGFPLVIFGTALLLGYKTRWAALFLLLLLIPITISAQIGSPELVGPFFKNVAIGGVLLFFVMNKKIEV